MKIVNVRTVLLSAPQLDFHTEGRSMRSASFILIETDTEHVGIGETYCGYFCPELVPGIVEFYAPVLIDADPLKVDLLSRRLFHCGKFWARVGLGSAVLSGIEMALLDLKGKALGVPVYELLGGRCHESIPCYASGGPPLPNDQLEPMIAYYLSLGFSQVKIGAGMWQPGVPLFPHRSALAAAEVEVRKLEFLRQRFGATLEVLLDAHMDNLPEDCHVWDEDAAATVLEALAPFALGFFEEPLPYTNKRAYAGLRRRSSIRVAGGECITSLEEWNDWLVEEPFGLAQLDAAFMGGLTNFVKVAHQCEARGIPIATHSWSAAVGLAGNLHAAFACRNAQILELAAFNPGRPDLNTHWNSPLLSDLWVEPPEVKDGCISLPAVPGLGVHLPSDLIDKYPFQPGTGEFNDVVGKTLKT